MQDVQHITIYIHLAPAAVYAFARNPENLPLWAAGLAQSTVTREGDSWVADAPFGRVRSQFTFTLLRQPGMTDEQFAADAKAVATDLKTLKNWLER